MTKFGVVLLALAFPVLAACSYLPAAAPTAGEVERPSGADATQNFVILDLSDRAVEVLRGVRSTLLNEIFPSHTRPADLRIAVGDTIQVSILENGAAGVYTLAPPAPTQGGRSATLQQVVVGRDGEINVPFVGDVRAVNRTADELRAALDRKLEAQSSGSRSSVFVQPSLGNSVTVGGEVNRAAVVPLTLHGERLLDVIAEAGGAKYPTYETVVRFTRGGRTASVTLESIVDTASENIYVAPLDNIYLIRQPESFAVLGSSGRTGQYAFDGPTLTLAEAISKSGGLVDTQSDPGALYLFRVLPGRRVNAIAPGSVTEDKENVGVPVAFKINMRDGDGYVRAQQFPMQNKDVLLVANADATQWLKAFTLLRGVTGAVGDVTGKPAKP